MEYTIKILPYYLMSIVQHTGWVCIDCQSTIKQLKCAQAKTTEDLASICNAVTRLQHEVSDVQQQCKTWPSLPSKPGNKQPDVQTRKTTEADIVPDNTQVSTNVALKVHRALSDMSRRKRNVVVTGIPEQDGDDHNDDEMSFLKLCEENFSFKPILSRFGCRRLGQRTGAQPRKLLVHLTSEQVTKDLLKESHKLWKSQQTCAVYINPDLTPAKAAIAFQARERRRRSAARERECQQPVTNSETADGNHVTQPRNHTDQSLDCTTQTTTDVSDSTSQNPPTAASPFPSK